MAASRRLQPAGIRERRPLADGMAKRSLAVRKLSRPGKTPARFHTDLFRSLFRALRPSRDKEIMEIFALCGRRILRSFDTASRNFASDAAMPTSRGYVASQSECSIGCSAIAVVQGCCLFSQTELRGFSKSGSANIPTATAINSGRCSGSQKTVPPHSGQKLNVTVLPLSARRAYRLTRPLASRTCSRG